MSITVRCPRLRCRAILRVPDSVRGKQVRCSSCGMALTVPDPTAKKGAETSPAKREKSVGDEGAAKP